MVYARARARLLTPRPVFSFFPAVRKAFGSRLHLPRVYYNNIIARAHTHTLARAHTTAGARRVRRAADWRPGLPMKYIMWRRPRRRTRDARMCVSRGDADAVVDE
jgi:hypothetical protein